MKISRCQDGTSKSWSSSSSTVFPSAMTPLNLTTLTLAVFLMSAIPLCRSAPVFLNPATIEHDLLTQIIKVCTSQLSAERPLRTQDGLQDLCGLMLEVVRTAKELPVRDTSKRLMPQLHSRRRRRTAPLEELQSPRTIQSRGYFLYRPRNGRRSTEYV